MHCILIDLKITAVRLQLGEQGHRISLYADDVNLFLTNLKDNIPNLIKLIKQFGEFSGYKINVS